MPQLGEIKNGKEIEHKTNRPHIWHACIVCGKERWVLFINRKPRFLHCKAHAKRGKLSACWKGGRYYSWQGYVYILLETNNPFIPMSSQGYYVLEHRLVMATHLGRCLLRSEQVHHKNGIKDDNRIENLELTTCGKHIEQRHKGYRDGYKQGYKDGANLKIQELSTEIKLLRLQLKEENCVP